MVRRGLFPLLLVLALGSPLPVASPAAAQCRPAQDIATAAQQPPPEEPPEALPPEEQPPTDTETVPVPVPPVEPPGGPGQDLPDVSARTGGEVLPLSAAGLLLLGLGAWLRRTARRGPGRRDAAPPEPGSAFGG
jgi:hypothetical protein